jgi:hypothetical protein
VEISVDATDRARGRERQAGLLTGLFEERAGS